MNDRAATILTNIVGGILIVVLGVPIVGFILALAACIIAVAYFALSIISTIFTM